MVEGRRMRRVQMAVNNSWTRYTYLTWARVFFFSNSTRWNDTGPTQHCSYLCYCPIATKREVIRFTVVLPGASDILLMTFKPNNSIWNLLLHVSIIKTDKGENGVTTFPNMIIIYGKYNSNTR